MKRLGWLAVLFLVVGCSCPIRKSTFLQQKPAVQAATESSRDAEKNWASYNEDQQKRWLKANTKAWEGLNRTYNPKKNE
jgi:uncharacterized protein YceK